MEYTTVQLERRDHIAWLTLNRPESLNAMNRALVQDLRAFFSGLAQDLDTYVVILRGAGRAFCAGLDLKESASEVSDDASVSAALRGQRGLSELMIMMRRAPQPIIAAVHGPACGGGFALALGADVRIAGESARMNAAFIRLGVSGCDVGVSYFLPRMLGASVAAELLLTGNFINAARAERLGLVSRVVPDAELTQAAQALADDMLRNSPLGLRLTKECLNASLDAGGLEQVIAMEDRNQILCTRTDDFREGVMAFLQKRPPQFTDR
jgi:enoyl-CoA hydratase/carnithine racemase